MYKCSITFLALGDNALFYIKSAKKEAMDSLVAGLLQTFSKVDEEDKKAVALHQNNVENRKKINALIEKFRGKLPEVNALSRFFRKLKENENFCFLLNFKLDEIGKFKALYDRLRAVVGKGEAKNLIKKFGNYLRNLTHYSP